MGGVLIIVSIILAALVDFGTTAVGAVEAFSMAGLLVGLALQMGQLSTLLLLRAKEIRGGVRTAVIALAVIITAINAAFNYYALHGLLETTTSSTLSAALRSLTPSDPWWLWNWSLMALCVFISTELDAAIYQLSRMRGHITLLGSSIPLYKTPITSLRAFWSGIASGEGKETPNAMLLAIPPLMVFLLAARLLDGYSTYATLVGIVVPPTFWASAVAAYIALMAATYQTRAVILFQTKTDIGVLETVRIVVITALNIFCSVSFFSEWEDVAPLAFGLGLLVSTLTEVIEGGIATTLVATALGQSSGPLRITESKLIEMIQQQARQIDEAYRLLGASLGGPIRVILQAAMNSGGPEIQVVPDPGQQRDQSDPIQQRDGEESARHGDKVASTEISETQLNPRRNFFRSVLSTEGTKGRG